MTRIVSTVDKLVWVVTEAMSDFAMACLYPKTPSLHFQIKLLGHECMGKVHEISDLLAISEL